MPRLSSALDADVLVPILSCDLLLTAFNSRLYEPVVDSATCMVHRTRMTPCANHEQKVAAWFGID